MTSVNSSRATQMLTTGIGSLPHHNVDSALQFSFRMDIPFLPQIPIRNPWEYMIAQALEGLPGLQIESDGTATVNLEIWESRSADLDRRLKEAIALADSRPDAFEEFEPSTAVSSSWQSFVWELEERGAHQAKVQMAGPLTTQWSLRTRDGQSLDRHPQVSMQIYRLVLARSLAMIRRLKIAGIRPIIYLDEPGLYGLLASTPKHALGLQELRLMVQTLRKEGAQIGIHCCSNTDWDAIMSLGPHILSLDASLSLKNLMSGDRPARVAEFIRSGGRLSLGVIPTARSSVLHSLQAETLFSELLSCFQAWRDEPELIRTVLTEAIYTPACGLALHTVSDAELVMETLLELRDYGAYALRGGVAAGLGKGSL